MAFPSKAFLPASARRGAPGGRMTARETTERRNGGTKQDRLTDPGDIGSLINYRDGDPAPASRTPSPGHGEADTQVFWGGHPPLRTFSEDLGCLGRSKMTAGCRGSPWDRLDTGPPPCLSWKEPRTPRGFQKVSPGAGRQGWDLWGPSFRNRLHVRTVKMYDLRFCLHLTLGYIVHHELRGTHSDFSKYCSN